MFQGFRSDVGEEMILDRNLFVERVLPASILLSLTPLAIPLSWPHEGGDDAVQGAQLLLGAEGALEEVAQVARHARALVGVAQKPALAQRFLEMLEKAQ